MLFQIPDVRTAENKINVVVVDEEAVGSEGRPGCGAKILYGQGAFDSYLSEHNLKDSEVSARISISIAGFLFVFQVNLCFQLIIFKYLDSKLCLFVFMLHSPMLNLKWNQSCLLLLPACNLFVIYFYSHSCI